MSDRDQTPGGWLLISGDAAAVIADLKAFGQVFRFPVDDDGPAAAMTAGDPCFLYVEEPGRAEVKPGIWAVGEVVGPCYRDDDGDPWAEVELIPLDQRITKDLLRGHRILSGLVVFEDRNRRNPLALTRAERRALEEFEFELRDPTDEQVARLEAELGTEGDGLLVQVFGADATLAIAGGADGFAVLIADDDGARELNRFPTLAGAFACLREAADTLAFDPPPTDGAGATAPPLVVVHTDDGTLQVHHGPEGALDLWDHGTTRHPTAAPSAPDHLATFASIDDAVAELADAVTAVDVD